MAKAVRVRTPSPLADILFWSDGVTTLRLWSRHARRGGPRTSRSLRAVWLRRATRRGPRRAARRCNRLETSDHLLGDVQISIGGNDDACFRPGVENECVAI